MVCLFLWASRQVKGGRYGSGAERGSFSFLLPPASPTILSDYPTIPPTLFAPGTSFVISTWLVPCTAPPPPDAGTNSLRSNLEQTAPAPATAMIFPGLELTPADIFDFWREEEGGKGWGDGCMPRESRMEGTGREGNAIWERGREWEGRKGWKREVRISTQTGGEKSSSQSVNQPGLRAVSRC